MTRRNIDNDIKVSLVISKRWIILVLLICVSIVCVYLWRQNYQPTMVLRVETVPSTGEILQLHRVIEAQKKTIELYAKRPKVVFRCLDDEPTVKYPRHASDGYTSVSMGTNDECGKTEELDAVIIVHSSAKNFKKRDSFRAIYSNYTVTKPYRLKVVFLLGQVQDAELQINLEMENRQFGDTIQGNFVDTYHNLTLKAVMGYRWVSATCQNYKLLLKMDDDVAFDTHQFFGKFWHDLRKDKKVGRIFCQVWKNASVNRKGKWKVEKGLFRNATYDFQYCSGFFVAITPDLVNNMYKASKELDFFWIDDVFMYGMVPHTFDIVGFTQLGGKANRITQTMPVYKKCLQNKGIDCPYFAVVTQSDQELMEIHNTFPHQLLAKNVTSTPPRPPSEEKVKTPPSGEKVKTVKKV